MEDTKANGKTEISGKDAFTLYDTFGFQMCIRDRDTTTLGGSQFDVDVIICQAYLIITGMSTFILVGEFRVDAKRCFRFFIGKGDWHERDVIQISRSSAGEMCVAETGNRTVRIEDVYKRQGKRYPPTLEFSKDG